jgi:ApbE superfamily uncharacterized protein (UPF0280 family)
MIVAPQCTSLPDGRLHFSHGPIDLLIQADGKADAIRAAHERAWRRFETILPELVSELPALQRPVDDSCDVAGAVARRMWRACHPFRRGFITSMAAVAGSVAEEIAGCYAQTGIDRAAVNNGGDIALYLSAGASYRVGICTDIVTSTENAMRGKLSADGDMLIEAHMPIRGVATSGWRGRSFSLGIADSVTVLAGTASQADAAATVIANAVNVDDPRVKRVPACDLKDNTDLGDTPVTADVPPLESGLVDAALRAGLEQARRLQAAGLICDAVLVCQGRVVRVHGDVSELLQPGRRLSNPPASVAGRLSAVMV